MTYKCLNFIVLLFLSLGITAQTAATRKINREKCSEEKKVANPATNVKFEKPVITIKGNDLNTPSATHYQWYFNGNPIASSNTSTIKALNYGYYSVMIKNEKGDSAISDSINITSTNVPSNKDSEDITMYPNPINKEVKISIPKEDKGKLSLIDADGNKINEIKLSGDKTEHLFSLEDLSSGLFMIVYTNEKGKSKINSIIKL